MMGQRFVAALLVMMLCGGLMPAPATNVANLLGDATGLHLLGFDEVGRDVLQQLWRSGGLSLGIALAAALLSMTIACLLGFWAAHSARRRGIVDAALLRVADGAAAVPVLPMFMIAAAVFLHDSNLSGRMTLIIVGLGLCGWPSLTRTVRTLSLEILSGDPVRAAIGFGAGPWHLARVHVAPTLRPMVTSHVCADVASNLVSEASLSLLGVGLTPPDTTLGTMLGSAWPHLSRDPPLVLLPIAVMMLLALALQSLSNPPLPTDHNPDNPSR
jgi:peptide/nickel transport system permease protein